VSIADAAADRTRIGKGNMRAAGRDPGRSKKSPATWRGDSHGSTSLSPPR